MTLLTPEAPETEIGAYSDDQATAFDRVCDFIAQSGLTLEGFPAASLGSRDDVDAELGRVFAILGKAGSGKTRLLADLGQMLADADVEQIGGDHDIKRSGRRTFAIVAPTNKAASVLRNRGVEATTIHRIIYTPMYDPEYEKIAEWLAEGGKGERPEHASLAEGMLERALAFFEETKSIPAALASAGLRGSEFITGWTRRDDSIDIGLVDEASMLDDKQLEDLRRVFDTLILFGDPAQLAPVGQSSAMAFDSLPETAIERLEQVHRQAAGNPIVELAYALADPELDFAGFERLLRDTAERDDRIVVAGRASAEKMARSPMLVWRNATRIRLIHAFRTAYGIPETVLEKGEPLICDGAEIPLKHRKKRIALEQAGLVKGAQVFYQGPGRKPGFARLYVAGAADPQISVAAIIQIERGVDAEPIIPLAARMGAVFLHGAACTIHKAQGSQWPEVQVFAPDLYAAARSGRMENGIPLWKRLAYVAITRAQERLFWITRYAMAKPDGAIAPIDQKTY